MATAHITLDGKPLCNMPWAKRREADPDSQYSFAFCSSPEQTAKAEAEDLRKIFPKADIQVVLGDCPNDLSHQTSEA
jgi:hypothetical protein